VARDIRRRIAQRDLRPGDHLPPEDELMATLGLARTTVREGLRILESQGLIEVQRGRGGGGRVTYPSIDRLTDAFALSLQLQGAAYRDLVEAWRLIEPMLAGRLAATHTDDDVETLAGLADEAAVAARADDPVAFGWAAHRFHDELVGRAGNAALATLARLLRELLADAGPATPEPNPDRAVLVGDVRAYRKLVRLIDDGDVAGAEAHCRAKMLALSQARSKDPAPVSFA
jgi:GntR family transcriptional regulator, transcriptional repressor for pyruvate dehydrogenase complex